MRPILFVWLPLAVVYAVFCFWYTPLGGPLTDQEIETYMAYFESTGTRDAAGLQQIRQFMEQDTGNDFAMINLIDMNDTPQQVDGVNPGDSSDDVLGKYMEYMYPALFQRACHPVMYGTAANSAMDLVNADGMEQWSRGVLMRYRSRRDLFDIASNPQFSGRHDFKIAALRKTIAFPLDPWYQLGDPRLVLALLLIVIAGPLGHLFRRRDPS